MNNKSNIYTAIFSVLFVIVLISGVTLAVYTWSTTNEEEKVLEGEATCFDIDYVKGQDIGSNENMETLTLGRDYTDGLSTTIKIGINPECVGIEGVGTLYLTTEDETDDYLIDNGLLNYAVNGSFTDGTNEAYIDTAFGVIDSKGTIPIYDHIDLISGTDINLGYVLKVYVWVDGETVTNDNVEQVMNSVYKGYISATVESRG